MIITIIIIIILLLLLLYNSNSSSKFQLQKNEIWPINAIRTKLVVEYGNRGLRSDRKAFGVFADHCRL